jgi:branched-chain amino acid aminotransferase
MASDGQFIWMNGKLVEWDNAKVHFLSASLHYGIGIFEGIRCYNTDRGPAVFRLREHMQRLINSAKILGWKRLPYTVNELIEAAKEVVKANRSTDCYIRPLVYQDSPLPSLNLDSGNPRIGIASWKFDSYLGKDALERGIRANVSSFTRHHINVMMTKAKITGNYSNSVLAKTESVRLGFDEAIMLDPQGFVAECSGENLFLVRAGKIYTTPATTILEGITRDALITLANDLDIPVIEQPISRDQLYISDEVFVSGTAAECIAVCEIDNRMIGNGKMGFITREIQKTFLDAIHGRHERSSEWLTFVNE